MAETVNPESKNLGPNEVSKSLIDSFPNSSEKDKATPGEKGGKGRREGQDGREVVVHRGLSGCAAVKFPQSLKKTFRLSRGVASCSVIFEVLRVPFCCPYRPCWHHLHRRQQGHRRTRRHQGEACCSLELLP